MNKLTRFFPHKEIRPVQDKILNKIEECVDNNNIRYIVLEAGTGIGKSAIAKTLSGYFGNSYVLTSTKMLQEQYENEFKNFDVSLLKGKGNYACALDPKMSCAHGKCLETAGTKATCNKFNRCPYSNAFDQAMRSEMFISSYALFLSFASHKKTKDTLVPRDIIVIDECHLLDDTLVDLAKVDVDLEDIEKKFFAEANLSFREECYFHKTFSNDDEKNIEILRTINEMLEKRIQENKIRISNLIGTEDKELKKELFEKYKEKEEMEEYTRRIFNYVETYDSGNWITKCEGTSILCLPIASKTMFKEFIDRKAIKKVLFMSATIFGKNNFCQELGIDPDKTMYISEQSTFDPHRSPVVLNPILSFKMGEYDKTVDKAKNIVKDIIATHKNSKGIIHTGNYKVMNFLVNRIPSKRFIYKQNNASNEYLVKVHEKAKVASILVSPSMMSGVDLKEDLSRFQIIMKLPYASLSDPRIQYISKTNFTFYAIKMLREFVQACGRSTRSEDDWSVTYVLDKGFIRIWNNFKRYLPYFAQRLISYDNFDLNKFMNGIKAMDKEKNNEEEFF